MIGLFIKKIIIFSSIIFLIYEGIYLYSIITGEYKKKVAGSEVYYAVFKSKKKNKKAKILILGDSVGNQLFGAYRYDGEINSLATNQAISVVGQFFLLNNYVKAGNTVEKVYLIYSPFSFKNNLDQIWTYQYFLKPFARFEYFKDFTEIVKTQIKKIPCYELFWLPSIFVSNWGPKIKCECEVNYTFLSPISIEYIHKIKKLAKENNFQFKILPAPIPKSRFPEINKINMQEVYKNGFSNEFSSYFDDIVYLDDEKFIDGIHLKDSSDLTVFYINKFFKINRLNCIEIISTYFLLSFLCFF